MFTLELASLDFLWSLKAVLFTLSWLFEGLGRDKAEELLQLPDTKIGSFMIRESETKKGEPCFLFFGFCFINIWPHSPRCSQLPCYRSIPLLPHACRDCGLR